MENKTSKLKVGLSSLLGYVVLNVIRNTLFSIISIFLGAIGTNFFRYRLEDIAFFFTFYIGYIVSIVIGEKILKEEDAIRRYTATIGLLLIINYIYIFIDYFRYNEGKLFYIISSLFVGILLFFGNRKKSDNEE